MTLPVIIPQHQLQFLNNRFLTKPMMAAGTLQSHSVWQAIPGSPLPLTFSFKNKTPLIVYQKPCFLCVASGQINISIPWAWGVGQNSPSCQHFYPTSSCGLYLFHFSTLVLAHSIHWIPIWRRMWLRGHAIWTNLIGCQLQSDRHSTPVPCGYAQWHWLPSVVRPTRSLGRWEGRGWPIWDCHFPSALASHLMTS